MQLREMPISLRVELSPPFDLFARHPDSRPRDLVVPHPRLDLLYYEEYTTLCGACQAVRSPEHLGVHDLVHEQAPLHPAQRGRDGLESSDL